MPKGTKGMLAWDAVEKKIAAAHTYWICTTRPDGRPHTMPVWAVWVDGALYFGTDRESRKARNIQVSPAIAAHLELLDEAVILEGKAEEVTDRAKLPPVDAAYNKKYKMKLTDAPGDLFVVKLWPNVVFAWTERQFSTSPTRFEFLREL